MTNFDEIMKRLGAFPILPATRRDPTTGDISAFENVIGGSLPADYRAFLSRFGMMGLKTSPKFRIEEPTPFGQTASISGFFGFSCRPEQSIVEATMSTYAGRIPDPTIPIGEDALGNLILLGFAGPFLDRVYFWDHDFRGFDADMDAQAATMQRHGIDTVRSSTEDIARDALSRRERKPAGFENVYRVAGTFTAFLESLRPDSNYS